MVRTLIIARHGDYDPDTGSLDDDGVAGIRNLADAIKNFATLPVVIITSPIQRARETAELMASLLPGAVEVIQCHALADGVEVSSTDRNALIDNAVANAVKDAGAVVLITHDQVAHEYLNYYLRRTFGLDHPRHFQIGYAEAAVVNARDGRVGVTS